MKLKLVADSCCDLTKEMKNEMQVTLVPLKLDLNGVHYTDDESLKLPEYITAMKNCPTSPKTSCPSPEEYMKSFSGDESTFVVTLSSNLSGSYNSAEVAKNMYCEENEGKFIHIFNSLSASAGETVIINKLYELSKLNLSDLEIVHKVNDYISEMKTFFLLESLDHLAKAGRLNPLISKVASMLDIKPIMGANCHGEIKLVEKIRGYKKAFKKLVDIIGEEGSNLEDKVLGIAHCNCFDRALAFKEEVLKKYNFKDILIVEMGGLSTSYADDGGIVIAF